MGTACPATARSAGWFGCATRWPSRRVWPTSTRTARGAGDRRQDRAAGRSPLHVVTAFGAGARVSVGQRAVGRGEDEITAARALLATLTLDGARVTGDAIHAREGTAQRILDRGGDQLFALGANRPAMLRELTVFCADPPAPSQAFETADADHGRIETRRHRVTHSADGLFGDRAAPAMPGLATLACVEARRDDGAPRPAIVPKAPEKDRNPRVSRFTGDA